MKNSILLFSIVLLTAFNTSDEKKETGVLQQDMLSGTWKYQNGNEVFIVNIWKEGNGVRGHFRKVIVDSTGNEVSVVYKSNRKLGPGSNYDWPPAIYTANAGVYKINAIITDNTIPDTLNTTGYIDGYLKMVVLNPSCYTSGCTLQAQWTVKKRPGLRIAGEPDFNIPTNIILTKQ